MENQGSIFSESDIISTSPAPQTKFTFNSPTCIWILLLLKKMHISPESLRSDHGFNFFNYNLNEKIR